MNAKARVIPGLAIGLCLLFSPVVPIHARAASAALDERIIADAYVYLIGRALVVRQEHLDIAAQGGYNVAFHNRLGSADFVNPNLSVANTEAWIAVDDETSVLLEIPKIVGRYYTAQILDEWGETLSNIHELHFPKDALPQDVVNAFWSLHLVGVPDFMPVPNRLDRFMLSTYSNVKKNHDGSLTLILGPEPAPGVPESNWLPTAPGRPFSLNWRTYVPKEIVKQGNWFPPVVSPID